MAVDWNTVRENRQASQGPAPSDWDAREAAAVADMRRMVAAQREEDQHKAELAAAVAWSERKAAAASRAGNPDDTSLWTAAAETLKAGNWPIHRRIASSPDVTAHQACRTRLLYQGATARLDD